MDGTARDDEPSVDLVESPTFPIPNVTLSLRHAIAYRGRDDDGEPILIISDGVSAVALESGLSGPSPEVVVAARGLAAIAEVFARGMAELLPDPPASGPTGTRRTVAPRQVPRVGPCDAA
jgi:hypothetical protein